MPTEEELRASVPPESVIVELNDFSTSSGISFVKIKDEYYNILVKPYLNSHEGENRAIQASKIVMAQLLDKMSYQTSLMEIQIIDRSSVKEIFKEVTEMDPVTGTPIKKKITKYLMKVFCIAAGGDEASEIKPNIGVINFWDDMCELGSTLNPGDTYKVKLGVTQYENYYDLSAPEGTDFAPIKLDIPSPVELIEKLLNPISVSEAPFNLSSDSYDFKLLRGRIRSSRVSLTRKGKNMGFVNIFDDNVSLSSYSAGSGQQLTILFSDAPEMADRYITGSECYFLTSIEDDPDNGMSCWGQLIIPIMVIMNKEYEDKVNKSKQTTLPSSTSDPNLKSTSDPNLKSTLDPNTESTVPSPSSVRW